ncbi:MAG: protoheme IX farnesyltransferase [Candidatus Heimdallarchaeota archaeon]
MTRLEIQDSIQGYGAPMYPSFSFSLYGELIKAKQTFLLMYTVAFAFLISAWPIGIILADFFWLLVGLFLAISGSTMLNMYIDRDIDATMGRTRGRPLPSNRIRPSTVLFHGLAFSTAGILVTGVFINPLTMTMVFLGCFFDVVIYSLWLKRRTRFSIIFGGIAGGLPAIAGRTAVTGALDIIGLLLGLFVLSWIPLHILSIALIPRNLEGYKNCNIPIWPVVKGEIQTYRVITISALLSSFIIIVLGILLKINPLAWLILLVFCFFIFYQAITNLKRPSNTRTYRIFKLASLFMAFAFFWLFMGVAFS